MSLESLPESQRKALAIVPKVTGGISFCCSCLIFQHVLRDPKKRKSTYHRLMAGMSLSDMFGSFFGFFLSTWPFPKETGMFGASGSLQTCDAAGFFVRLTECNHFDFKSLEQRMSNWASPFVSIHRTTQEMCARLSTTDLLLPFISCCCVTIGRILKSKRSNPTCMRCHF